MDDINKPSDFDSTSEELDHRGRVRVRKRIRVKKKKSPKRKLSKFFEKVLWMLFLLGFVLTVIYLLKELDMSDKRYKKKSEINIKTYSFQEAGKA